MEAKLGDLYEPGFELEYETRTESARFLKTLDMTLKNSNVDFHFMASSFEYIEAYFKAKSKNDRRVMASYLTRLNKYFMSSVSVIWYEVDSTEDGFSLLERLYKGKPENMSFLENAMDSLVEVSKNSNESNAIIAIDDEHLNAISELYLEECRNLKQYDWRYYYITYPCFRSERFGKYTKMAETPYTMVALHTEHKESSNAYQCMLEALIDESAVANSTEWLEIRTLSYRKGGLTCWNDTFASFALSDGRTRAYFEIPPNEEGIDTVDRIQYFKENRRNDDMWTVPED